MCASAPTWVYPATYQKTLSASAPPIKITVVFAVCVRTPAICMVDSLVLPSNMTSGSLSPMTTGDGGVAAIEVDGVDDVDVLVEGVDAGRQWIVSAAMVVAECASSDIPPIGIVRGLHVVDCLGQLRRSGRGVVGREGLAVVAELRGRRKFVTRVSDQAEAGHGGCVDGRDADVAGDV
jgi:hypothetical protein